MSEQAATTQRVKAAVVRALGLQVQPDELGDDDALFGEGTGTDPVLSLRIVSALEDEFAIRVEDEDLRAEIFDSVRSLAELVTQKVGTRAGAP